MEKALLRTTTSSNTQSIEVNGEVSASVWINGSKRGVLTKDGKLRLKIDTSGNAGNIIAPATKADFKAKNANGIKLLTFFLMTINVNFFLMEWLIPTMSMSQYLGTIVKWFGADEAMINRLFPERGNFTQSDLGFMA